jgi:outer membrane lipoprotein-sorting protein
MLTKYWRLAMLQLLLCTSSVSAQPSGATTLLTKALQQYQGLTQYRAEALQLYAVGNTGTSYQVHRTIQVSGIKVFSEQHEPSHLLTIVDGVNIWIYSPERLEYSQRPFEPTIEPVEISTLQRYASASIADAKALTDETIPFKGGWSVCTVVRATFNIAKGSTDVAFWIDKTEQVIRKAVYFTKDGRPGVTTVILNMDTGAQIPSSQFNFVPPGNAVRLPIMKSFMSQQ